METIWHDLRYGLRLLRQRPALTLAAIATLALAIGANTVIFSVVNSVLLRPFPFSEPERLVALRESHAPEQSDSQIAPADFLDWQAQNTVMSSLSAYRTVSYNLATDGAPERVLAGRVSAGLFRMLGVSLSQGRDFLPEEDAPGGEKTAIISSGLWQRRFGGSPDVIGRTLKLSGESYTIIGVLPSGFRLPDMDREIWTPIAFDQNERELRQAHYIEAIGRLKPGITLGQAQAEMTAIAARIEQQHTDTNLDWRVRLVPLADFFVRDVRTILWLLAGAVAFVLLIACANVANLMLVHAAGRQKEIAIRAALGARRGRIVRQMLTESLLLALGGGVSGWILALWGLQALLSLAPRDLPRTGAVSLDQRALFFTLAITLLTGLIFGLAPAFELSKPDLNSALKEASGDGNRGPRWRHVGSVLVVSEVALALVLLIGGGLLLRTLWQLRQVDPGFDYHNALAVTIQLPEKKYASDEKVNLFSQELLRRISALPGVQSVGIARILPIIHNLPAGFYIEGRPREKDSQLAQTSYSAASSDYFKAMGIPVLRGRAFTDHDTESSPRVAIISAAMVDRFFPNEDPIGKRLAVMTSNRDFREIVGIVGDVKQNGLDRETRPQTYEPFAQAPNQFMTAVVRGAFDPVALTPQIRDQVLAIDSEQPLQSVRTLEDMISFSIRQQRFTATVLAIFAAAALALAAAGIYGVISYSVAQRRREIGIRVALGAPPRRILISVVAGGMKLTFLGLAMGVAASLLLTRLIAGFLFGVTATDPLTYAVIAALLLAIAFAACYFPARRAAKADPLTTLRCN